MQRYRPLLYPKKPTTKNDITFFVGTTQRVAYGGVSTFWERHVQRGRFTYVLPHDILNFVCMSTQDDCYYIHSLSNLYRNSEKITYTIVVLEIILGLTQLINDLYGSKIDAWKIIEQKVKPYQRRFTEYPVLRQGDFFIFKNMHRNSTMAPIKLRLSVGLEPSLVLHSLKSVWVTEDEYTRLTTYELPAQLKHKIHKILSEIDQTHTETAYAVTEIISKHFVIRDYFAILRFFIAQLFTAINAVDNFSAELFITWDEENNIFEIRGENADE